MKLLIVTGANGALGKAFLDRFSKQHDFFCTGISRSRVDCKVNKVTYLENVDLLDAESVRKKIDKELPLSQITEVLFVHPVGKFKFEKAKEPEIDIDRDGIDDEVYRSNVETFNNVEDPLLRLVKETGKINDLSLCGFGSVSDRYKVPFWPSYSKSKDILRRLISGKTRQDSSTLHIKGVFINVSSVKTGNEKKLRPYADTTYWLQPDEIVDDSSDALTRNRIRYMEIDMFKPIAGFNPAIYYSEEAVRERWMKEMGKTLGIT